MAVMASFANGMQLTVMNNLQLSKSIEQIHKTTSEVWGVRTLVMVATFVLATPVALRVQTLWPGLQQLISFGSCN